MHPYLVSLLVESRHDDLRRSARAQRPRRHNATPSRRWLRSRRRAA